MITDILLFITTTTLLRNQTNRSSYSPIEHHKNTTPSVAEKAYQLRDRMLLGTMLIEPSVSSCGFENKLLHRNQYLNCCRPGLDHEIWGYLLDYANIPYDLIQFKQGFHWGHYVNGTWTPGIKSLIADGTLDSVTIPFVYDVEQSKHFAYSYPFRQSVPIFVTHPTRIDFLQTLLPLFSVFDISVYAAFIGTYFALKFAMLYTRHRGLRFLHIFRNDRFSLLEKLSIFYDQLSKSHRHWKSANGRALSIVFSLMLLFAITLYRSSLLTQLLYPAKTTPKFTSFEDVVSHVANLEYRLIAKYDDDWFINTVYTSNLSIFVNMRTAIEVNAVAIEPDFPTLINKVYTGKYIYFTSTMEVPNIRRLYCDLQITRASELHRQWWHFILRNDSKWLEPLNEAIKINDQFVRYQMEKYSNTDNDSCERETWSMKRKKELPFGRPLELEPLLGTFLLLACGAVLGATMLAVELLCDFGGSAEKRNRVSDAFGVSVRYLSKPHQSATARAVNVSTPADDDTVTSDRLTPSYLALKHSLPLMPPMQPRQKRSVSWSTTVDCDSSVKV